MTARRFHRIIDGFMVQGGDPNTKDLTKESEYGMGGPGYSIEGEVSNRPDRFHVRGVISMGEFRFARYGWQPVLHLPGRSATIERRLYDFWQADQGR